MFEQLRALAGAISEQRGLSGCTRTYSPYKAPHDTGGTFLGPQRLQDNLTHFLESRSSRLEAILGLLEARGLDPAPALTSGEDPMPFLDALDRWVTEFWGLGSVSEQYLSHRFWTEHCDDGTVPLYGFLSDIGLLMGEILIAQRPVCRWSFNPKARNRERSSEVNRIIVGGLAIPDDDTIPSNHDPAYAAFSALRLVRKHPEPSLHGLTRNIRAMISYYPVLLAPERPVKHDIQR